MGSVEKAFGIGAGRPRFFFPSTSHKPHYVCYLMMKIAALFLLA
jgi:hypothetical protein